MNHDIVPVNAIGVTQPLDGVVYPDKEDLKRYIEAGILTSETLIGALMQSFKNNAGRVALRSSAGDLSYRELDSLSDRAAATLMKLGLEPLDRVLFQMANSSELIICMLACLKAGLIPVCTLVSHREAEMGYLAGHARARAIFVDGDHPRFDFVAFAQGLRQQHPSLKHIVVGRGPARDGVPNLDELIATSDPDEAKAQVANTVARLDPFQVAVFQLSGGTTGVPKIIPRMQNEYLYNMRAVFAWSGRSRDETVFCAGPLVHNAGMVCHWGPALLHGGSLVTDRDLSPEGLRNTFKKFRPTWLFLMRPVLVRLKEALKQAPMDLSYVRAVISSSHAQFVSQELGMPGFHFFGMAEGLIMSTRKSDGEEAIFQSVGTPVSPFDEVRLYRPGTEEQVAPGEVGELVCKGPYTLSGYYNASERNREAFTRDGFYRTGDLLSLRSFGDRQYFVFEGRIKDVINRGGEKINCDEVERALRDYPGLVDVAIVAMPDDVYIERGCAFVCMESGQSAPTLASFGKHLERHGLAKYKWPERIELLPSLPTTKSGKVSKPLLRERIKELVHAERLLLARGMNPENPTSEMTMNIAPSHTPPMPFLDGVHHTARPTWKLQETVRFYRDVLGLPLIHAISAKGWGREGHPDFVHFFFDSGNGSTIAFFYYIGTERPDYLTPRTDEFFYRGTHTAWRVNTREELERWKAMLEARGVEVSPLTRHEVIESIYFADPNGYPIEITVQLREFDARDKEDARLTVEAAMAADGEAARERRALADIDTVWRMKSDLLAKPQ
ncbi:AMP-binding protein [Noviherbaspirillum denitrificans]|uniref:AMP-binding protein n=1 Tax=Noviherbaspirillum denitrificans TaxID=1968433 RepID=UPI001F221850|nr:AMP-binding protein [Noviherbaspirillum denitrificans]